MYPYETEATATFLFLLLIPVSVALTLSDVIKAHVKAQRSPEEYRRYRPDLSFPMSMAIMLSAGLLALIEFDLKNKLLLPWEQIKIGLYVQLGALFLAGLVMLWLDYRCQKKKV